jgi:hypothetical protein
MQSDSVDATFLESPSTGGTRKIWALKLKVEKASPGLVIWKVPALV